jgi:hypothetical protein
MSALEQELLKALQYTLNYAQSLEKAAGVANARNVSLNQAREAIAKAQKGLDKGI